jgi:amino acid adenylation domain-containing protein
MDKKIIHHVFYKTADRFPDRIAIEEETRSISYQDLRRNVNRLSHLLLSSGIKKGEIIAVLLTPGIALTETLLAVFSTGAIYLPLDMGFSQKRFREIFTQCRPAMVITNDALYPELLGIIASADLPVSAVLLHNGAADFSHMPVFSTEGTFVQIKADELPFTDAATVIHPDDGNYIVYTSGSTGVGKAILGRHKSLSHFIHWEQKEFSITEDIRVGQLAQITFDATFRDIFVPLCSGGTLCIPAMSTRTHPTMLIQWLQRTGVNIIHCVPSLFKMLTNILALEGAGTPVLSELKYIFIAGEILYARDIAAWRSVAGMHTELINLYGTSESTLAKTFHRIKEVPAGTNAVIHAGKPIDNTIVAIIKDGVLCLPGEIGDIYIKTPFYTKGYYNDAPLTATIFVSNPLTNDPQDVFHRTGDLGRWLEEGNIEVLGRLDDQTKVNGVRVNLGEIKQALLSEPEVKDVYVMVNNETGSNEVICYYTGTISEESLRLYLKTVLNQYLVPAYIVKLTAFPLNIHGKVNRGALPKPKEILFAGSAYEPVINEQEQKIENIWKEVLMQEMIGRNISFFRMGGTSLKAMQVISRIYHEFHVQINLAEFFNAPFIARLSLLMTEKEGQIQEAILPVAKQATYEATPMQVDLWVTDQLRSSAGIHYNMVNTSSVKGVIDIVLFKQSVSAVINRHESLRTNFVQVGGIPRQLIQETFDIDRYFEYIPLDPLSDMVAIGEKRIYEERVKGFDLEQDPLLRIKLIQITTNEYLCVVTLHHIIADGWSVELLSRDLKRYYLQYSAGISHGLPALNVQYKDYSHWLNNQLKGHQRASLEHYWREELGGELPVTALPIDYPRPSQITFDSRIYHFEMDQPLSGALIALATRKKVTMFSLLNTIINVLLHKYSGDMELLTGAPFSGRLDKSLEDVVGLFVNVVLLRVSISKDDTFSALLERNKQQILNAWQQQVYPFNYLPSLLNYEVPENRFPFVNVLMQSQTGGIADSKPWDDEPEAFADDTIQFTAKTDITFNYAEDPSHIRFAIEYKTDLFHPTTIESFGKNICHIAETIIADEDILLAHIKLRRSADEDAEERMFKEQMRNL